MSVLTRESVIAQIMLEMAAQRQTREDKKCHVPGCNNVRRPGRRGCNKAHHQARIVHVMEQKEPVDESSGKCVKCGRFKKIALQSDVCVFCLTGKRKRKRVKRLIDESSSSDSEDDNQDSMDVSGDGVPRV